MSGLDFTVTTIDGEQTNLTQYAARALLIVNTASACAYTSQYAGLELLHRRYKDQGLVVLGFPCNQFGAQEVGSNEAIGNFCERNFGVSFPLFAKLEVNGKNAHPLFAFLKQKAPGLLGSQRIKWNFTKFLVSDEGRCIQRFAPQTEPTRIAVSIERALGAISKDRIHTCM